MNCNYRLVWNALSGTQVPAPETARGRGKSGVRSNARRLGALGVYAAGITLGGHAWALDANTLPGGGQVVGGSSTLTQSGNTLTVNQSSTRSIINWNSYNIGSQASVVYVQPGVDAVSLNRVVGNEASQIYGSLKANGQVFLINGNGVLFGRGAQVNVHGLLASTLDLDDADFGAGRLRFSGHGGSVRNDGSLMADDGGYIALLGGEVDNRGLISARLGSVLLGAGEAATLDFNGDGLLSVALDAGAAGALVDNSGSLTAEGGQVRLSARAADRVMSSLVNNSGHIEARGLVQRNGVIELTGDIVDNGGSIAANGAQGGAVNLHATSILQHGVIQADGSSGAGGTVALHATQALLQTTSGHISADGAAAGGAGGDVVLDGGGLAYLSGQVSADGATGGHLVASATTFTVAGARLSADGVTQGGSILLGGDLHGGHAGMAGLGNAQATRVTTGSTLSAAGTGGTIVVWSDGDTAYGGAAHTGPAGMIEVSAKQQLSYSGKADAGQGGHVLLDPYDLIIGTSTPTTYIDLASEAAGPNDQHGSGGVVDLGDVGGVPTVVVASPLDSFGGAPGAGSVYVYNSADGALISHLYGTQAGDAVGSDGVTVLPGSSNFVVASPQWNNATGAVTWGSASTGVSGEVSAANSLVGSTPGDLVGLNGVVALANGHYVVASSQWSDPADPAGLGYLVGAVTRGDGFTGISGEVSTANSLHGGTTGDQIGSSGVTALIDNGNYVIASPNWSDPADPVGLGFSVGAVTWVDGTVATTGPVTSANSLIGSHINDMVGIGGVTALTNGNFVVNSYLWNDNAGAVTWGDGLVGNGNTVVDAANSLVGKPFDAVTGFGGDLVGGGGVVALANGNYAVSSPYWSPDTANIVTQVGAVTWGDGQIGSVGEVVPGNSLVGSSMYDNVGLGAINNLTGEYSGGVVPLDDGNYVVVSPYWSDATDPLNSVLEVGAVTWRDGYSVSGDVAVGGGNSLIGNKPLDHVGVGGVVALDLGRYVVASHQWSLDADLATGAPAVTEVGAVTFVDPSLPGQGAAVVSADNSLVGSSEFDRVGYGTNGVDGIIALKVDGQATGNYVVSSPDWSRPAFALEPAAVVGAVTLGSGDGSTFGPVSELNSLTGSTDGDRIGSGGVFGLTNGHYVVSSPNWSNAEPLLDGTPSFFANVGAVTWRDGSLASPDVVTTTNSLHGSNDGDRVGNGGAELGLSLGPGFTGAGVVALANGNYVVVSPSWSSAEDPANVLTNAGAVTWRDGNGPSGGAVASTNSVIGLGAFDFVGANGVTPLASGDYSIASPWLTKDGVTMSGAVWVASGAPDGNVMASSIAVAVDQTLTLQADHDIIVNAPVLVEGSLVLDAGNAITLNAPIESTQQNATSLILHAGDSFINNAGPVALVTDVSSTWQVWSRDPLNDARGDLAYDFKQYDAVYGTSVVLGLGNGLFYSVAPVLEATLDPVAGPSVSKVYDGNTTADAAQFTLGATGMIDGDLVELTAASVDYASKNAGTGLDVIASGVTLVSATDSGRFVPVYGYKVAATGGTAVAAGDITPADLTVLGTTATTRAYDGTTDAQVTGSLSGLVDGETLTFTQTGTFDSANAGPRTVAVVNVVADNGATLASNYNLVNPTEDVVGQIDKATLTAIDTAATTKSYDGNTAAAITGTLSGLVNGETAVFSQSGTFDSANAGARTVEVANTVDFTGSALADNYTLVNPTENVAGQIDKATLTATNTAAATKTYDGNTAAAITGTLSGLVNGETAVFSQSGTFDSANAGARTVEVANTVDFTGSALADNYSLVNPTENVAGQIDKATLTATNTAAATKTYDGNTTAAITGTLSGLVNGETAGFSQSGTFDSANAGARTVEVANAVAFTGSALADNYTLVNPTESIAGQIDRATLTATNTAAATKTYDGNTTASITGTLAGLVNGESLTFTQTGSFDNANAGARAVAVVNSVADNGAALASNYNLVNPTENVAGQIDKATLTATNTAAATKTYDGNTAAAITGTLSGLVNGETAGFSQSGTFDSANAGARTVEVANAVAFTGSALADNYTLANPTESIAGQIDRATLTATNTAATTKTYDGNTAAQVTGALAGLVNGETAGFSQSGTFDSANAGARPSRWPTPWPSPARRWRTTTRWPTRRKVLPVRSIEPR
ncbi:MAG: filamentous hemagglutinin N-terminal domain-containing protein [Burkholderiales bacterium]|nr:filamentous hemagglutinin N-terminal domain-containing protein [Burkholderiales bacterium]